nr:heavy-metal-associated domain-containing protein [Stenoxybacter acetivorans]
MEQKIRFHIDGMTCQACATRIEKVLNRYAAVAAADDVVLSGEAWFDESHLTGESKPLLKRRAQ